VGASSMALEVYMRVHIDVYIVLGT